MTRAALDDLTAAGKIDADSRVDLARSRVGLVVRAGAYRPDVASVDALRAALLGARVIAISDGASGVYVTGRLLDRLGIRDAVAGKIRRIAGRPVALAVARGEADLGLQATSELLDVPGTDYIGALPPEVQQVTVLAAALTADARHGRAGRDFIDFLRSPAAMPVIMKTGLEPIAPAAHR